MNKHAQTSGQHKGIESQWKLDVVCKLVEKEKKWCRAEKKEVYCSPLSKLKPQMMSFSLCDTGVNISIQQALFIKMDYLETV